MRGGMWPPDLRRDPKSGCSDRASRRSSRARRGTLLWFRGGTLFLRLGSYPDRSAGRPVARFQASVGWLGFDPGSIDASRLDDQPASRFIVRHALDRFPWVVDRRGLHTCYRTFGSPNRICIHDGYRLPSTHLHWFRAVGAGPHTALSHTELHYTGLPNRFLMRSYVRRHVSPSRQRLTQLNLRIAPKPEKKRVRYSNEKTQRFLPLEVVM